MSWVTYLCTQFVVWLLCTVLSVKDNRHFSAGACALMLLWTLLLLTGCGGGDPEPDIPAPGVDCQARPELCA